MHNGAELVRSLYDSYQARDWAAAALLLHPDVRLQLPATAETLEGRDAVIGLQERYPEPWGDLTVLRVLGDLDTAAAEVEIVAEAETFRCAAFWRFRDARLSEGVEYWVTLGGDEPGPR